MLHVYLNIVCIKYLIAFEVGLRAFNLHIQGILLINYPKSKEYIKELSTLIRKVLPNNGLGYRVVLKPLQATQTFSAMIGKYVYLTLLH
jgi:hypothetical protein